MKNTLLMAIDLGTSFIKAGIYNAQGTCIASASEAVKDSRPGPGIFIQKGEDLLNSVLSCIKKTTEQLEDRSSDIAAISFTGQMSGVYGSG